MMKDNHVAGEGNAYYTLFCEYDPDLGRWWRPDPIFQPWQSPYSAFDGNPIMLTDVWGLESKEGDVTKNPNGDKITIARIDGEMGIIVEAVRPPISSKSSKNANTKAKSNWDSFVDGLLGAVASVGGTIDNLLRQVVDPRSAQDELSKGTRAFAHMITHPRETYQQWAALPTNEKWEVFGNVAGPIGISYLTGKFIPKAFDLGPAGLGFAPAVEMSFIYAAAVTNYGLSNFQLVAKAAEKAERAIGGIGRFAGTEKHIYSFKLLERYQKIYGNRGLRTNVYFNNEGLLGPNNKGFLDVWDQTNNIIYDFKFGKTGMSKNQYEKYFRNFDLPIIVIRP